MTIDPKMCVPAPRLDNQHPALFGQTPSQTIGPFFHYGLPWTGGADLYGQSYMGARPELFTEKHYLPNLSAPRGRPIGEPIFAYGRILDRDGMPVSDAMVELWQANAAGRYRSLCDTGTARPLDPAFVGFGRAATDDYGVWRFQTIRPGRVPGPGETMQAPHLALSVFAPGILKRLATRLYFADGEGNDVDPVLLAVPVRRRRTLIARADSDGEWRFDIVLSGVDETVFFDL